MSTREIINKVDSGKLSEYQEKVKNILLLSSEKLNLQITDAGYDEDSKELIFTNRSERGLFAFIITSSNTCIYFYYPSSKKYYSLESKEVKDVENISIYIYSFLKATQLRRLGNLGSEYEEVLCYLYDSFY